MTSRKIKPLDIRPFKRWCVLSPGKPTRAFRAQTFLPSDLKAEDGFLGLHTGLPPFGDTRFTISWHQHRLQVAVAPQNSVGDAGRDDTIEMLFDPYNDGVGYVQFVFQVSAPTGMTHHLPYAKARSTRFVMPQAKWSRVIRKDECNVVGRFDPQWFFCAEFDLRDVFRAGDVCGFNICRYHTSLKEGSSWNLCSGHGFQDASSFGKLYRHAPQTLELQSSSMEQGKLKLQGKVSVSSGRLMIKLADPLGREFRKSITIRAGKWQTAFTLPSSVLGGSYRIYPIIDDHVIEPNVLTFELPAAIPPPKPILGMFIDFPDDLRNHAFTPPVLEAHMKQLASWGVNRVHWIDYGNLKDSPSILEASESHSSNDKAMPDNLLSEAVRLSHRHGMTCFATFKLFDQCFPHRRFEQPSIDRVMQDDGWYSAALRRVLENQQSTFASHHEWWPQGQVIQRIELVSTQPMTAISPSQIQLHASSDNQRYESVAFTGKFKQYSERRPHLRWTPAGPVHDKGSQMVHVLSLEGMQITHPFVSLHITTPGFECRHRRFALANVDDAKNNRISCQLAWKGDPESGFNFSPPWPSWANHDERILCASVLNHSSPIGLMCKPPGHIASILEPASGQTHAAWLGEIQRLLDAGVDGVDLRILAHHITCNDWSLYAYHPEVLAKFEEAFLRPVRPTAEDSFVLSEMRGNALTVFLKQAARLIHQYNKKLAVHLEPGVEIKGQMHRRMAINLPWEAWIKEKIVDELTLKFWSAGNAFIHEQVLPYARALGIAVHVCDSNSTLHAPRGIERALKLGADIRAMGYDGLLFYENNDYQRTNPQGMTQVLGHAGHAISAAAKNLNEA